MEGGREKGSAGTLKRLVEDYVLEMLKIGFEMLLVEFGKKALCERGDGEVY